MIWFSLREILLYLYDDTFFLWNTGRYWLHLFPFDCIVLDDELFFRVGEEWRDKGIEFEIRWRLGLFRLLDGLDRPGCFGSGFGLFVFHFESEVGDGVEGHLIFLLHLIIKSLIFLSDGDWYSFFPPELHFPVEFFIIFNLHNIYLSVFLFLFPILYPVDNFLPAFELLEVGNRWSFHFSFFLTVKYQDTVIQIILNSMQTGSICLLLKYVNAIGF